MDRRTFLKSAAALPLIPVAISASTNDDDLPSVKHRWPYIVYLYERGQSEWIFSQNVEGAFKEQNEYKAFDEPENEYCGFMYNGKLHFHTIDRATSFIEDHARTKDDINIVDSIYDVYYENEEGTEIQVAHYWYNGDTGRQVHWISNTPHMDWSKVECS
ncbi:hypothetical protein H8E06_01350 [bacterium]|nr:hypothetical protein [bacterium]